MKPLWHSAKRIIIKIGSSLLIDEGRLPEGRVAVFADC